MTNIQNDNLTVGYDADDRDHNRTLGPVIHIYHLEDSKLKER